MSGSYNIVWVVQCCVGSLIIFVLWLPTSDQNCVHVCQCSRLLHHFSISICPLLLVASLLLVVWPGVPLVASLLLVAMPFAPWFVKC